MTSNTATVAVNKRTFPPEKEKVIDFLPVYGEDDAGDVETDCDVRDIDIVAELFINKNGGKSLASASFLFPGHEFEGTLGTGEVFSCEVPEDGEIRHSGYSPSVSSRMPVEEQAA